MPQSWRLHILVCCALALIARDVRAAAPDAQSEQSWWQRKFVDPDDGKLDASEFLVSAYGFVPMATIITDPAVGYGGSLGLIFIRPNAVGEAGALKVYGKGERAQFDFTRV